MSKDAIDIGQLSQEERLELIEELWESLTEEEKHALPLTREQEEELNRRLDTLENEGPVGLTREQVRARLKRSAS